MKDNINMDNTVAGSMNDNIHVSMDTTVAGSMNDNINILPGFTWCRGHIFGLDCPCDPS